MAVGYGFVLPDIVPAKLKPSLRKGVFLGYVPNTTCNILWYDIKTFRIKIATHAHFKEGLNNLSVTEMLPNVAHLICTDNGQPVLPDIAELNASNASNFTFDAVPFVSIFTAWLKCSDYLNNNTFGTSFEDDPICHCTFVSNIAKHSASSAPCSSHKATCCKLLGAHVLEINHNCAFIAANAKAQLAHIHNQGVEEDFLITFALETKLKASNVYKCINESRLFATNTKWDENKDLVKDDEFMGQAADQTAHLNHLHHARI